MDKRILGAGVALLLAATTPATAANFSLGLQSGVYMPKLETEQLKSEFGSKIDETTWFLSPVFDLTFGDLGFTLKYLYAPYSHDGDAFKQDIDRHDIDFAAKYRLTPLAGTPLNVVPFLGFRYEIQNVDERSVDPQFNDLVIDGQSFDIYALAIGTTIAYGIADLGLTPYVVGTIFPYASVQSDDIRFRNGVPIGKIDESGFGGFAVEGGMLYSLARVLGVPMSAGVSYRYQDLDFGSDFRERLQQVVFGVFYTFRNVLGAA